MIIKRGQIVEHGGMQSWGSGMVVDVAEFNATIQFSDGAIRKIASSHYNILVAGDPATFVANESTAQMAIKPVVSQGKRKPLPTKPAKSR